jgi:hypothetical protein
MAASTVASRHYVILRPEHLAPLQIAVDLEAQLPAELMRPEPFTVSENLSGSSLGSIAAQLASGLVPW